MSYNNNYSVNYQNYQEQSLQQLTLFPPKDDPPPYPLQIIFIPERQRVKADWGYKLVHCESGLNIPGQFTQEEAQSILEQTRSWDFTLERERVPRCRDKLLLLLQKICQTSNFQEVAA